MIIVVATEAQDDILIDHYLVVWDSYGPVSGDYHPDARLIVREFIDADRSVGGQAGVLAFDGDVCTGSAICGILRSPYPEVLRTEKRLRGYIWSVYVNPIFRRRGIATGLTSHAVDRLREIGCTSVGASMRNADLVRRTRCGLTFE